MSAKGVRVSGVATLLGYDELQCLIGADRRTIRRWVQRGTFPGPVKLGGGGLARWRLTDVERFVAGLPTRP
jgi:predicted DNA-binding transcriptional regulator AlpA